VAVFLSRPTVKDEPDNEGRTAFLWAAGNGANAVISRFIEHGVDLLQMDKTGATG
jgi:ankyrin repeat protein